MPTLPMLIPHAQAAPTILMGCSPQCCSHPSSVQRAGMGTPWASLASSGHVCTG